MEKIMSKEITVLNTDKYKISAVDDYHNIFITVDGRIGEIPWSTVPYTIGRDFIRKYKTKEFEGFTVLNNYGVDGLELRVVKVDTESGVRAEFKGVYKLGIHKPIDDTVGFNYNMETEEYTITSKKSGDTVFKIEDLKYKENVMNKNPKPVLSEIDKIKDSTPVVSKELPHTVLIDLITDKYTVRIYEYRMCMFLVIGDTITKINTSVCYFTPVSDKIVLYKTKDFDGFAIFNNDYNTPFLTIVKVNPELDGTVELMGRYHLNKYITDHYTEVFTYDTVEEVFTVDNGNFKIEDLEVFNL